MARSPTATLVILCGCVVLSMTTWFSAAAVLPQLRALWQLSDSTAAWLTIAVQLGFVAGALLSAFTNLADLVPPRRLMAACAAVAALVNIGLLAAPGAASAIALRVLTGVVMAGIYPPALKLVATWFRAGRGLALGSVIGGLTLGSALPHLANAAGGLPWQGVIVSASVATLAGGAGVLLLVRDGPHPFPAARFDPAALCAGFANRAVLLTTAGYLGHMWELYAMWAWMLSFLRARLSTEGAWAASLLTFTILAAGAPACVAAGWAADRIGRTTTTIAAMLVSGACAAAIGVAWTAPLPVLVAIAVVWGIAVIADSAQFSACVTEAGEPRHVGTVLTAQLGLGFGLTAIAIWLLPRLAAWLGSWRWVFLFLTPGPLVGCVAMAVLRGLPEARLIAGGRR